jgi:hypothetical protein
MRKSVSFLSLCLLTVFTHAATLTVTTVDNNNTTAGQLSLKQAIEQAHDGDTIAFGIPGAGPHVLVTPENGYPLITQNNLTLDGYTQPGSSVNTNPILSSNNAVIKIVLDSITGPEGRFHLGTLNNPGFGDNESAIFTVLAAKNFKARGFSFQSRKTPTSDTDPGIYCFALVDDATNAHISGCWFGVAPDGVTINPGRASVAAFKGTSGTTASGLIIGTDGNGVNDRAEFNVHVGMEITIHLETPNVRVSGNLVNVYPDGVTVPDVSTVGEFIENGAGAGMLIGVNGDGISDDNEANVIGLVNYDTFVEFWRPGASGVVFAGNYLDVNTDRSVTNSSAANLFAIRKQSSVRIGTNGDGVSDDLEANHIYKLTVSSLMNWHGSNRDSGGVDAAKLVVRGNEMVNNTFGKVPFDGINPVTYGVYYTNVVSATTTNFAPTLRAEGAYLLGTIPARITGNYPYAFIDFYAAETAGLSSDPQRLHTRRLVRTILDNSVTDVDSTVNSFAVKISDLGLLAGERLIASVTYSMDANKTEVGRAVTSPFSAYTTPTPAPVIPSGGGAPGPYPSFSVSSANWIALGNENYDPGDVLFDLAENGPIPWSASRYNRADFAVRLSPANSTAARTNLNIGYTQVANETAADASGQAWAPNREAGIVIPTVRTNGPITYPDGQAAFFGTVAAATGSSGNGYDMVTGAFGSGGTDIETGKAGSVGEGNVNFATTWFPYAGGWLGGVVANPTGLGPAQWDGALSHSPLLGSANIVQWDSAGTAVLTLPNITTTNGAVFATSSDGASDVNIVTVSPSLGGDSWFIGVREDSATDPGVVSSSGQAEFQFVYFPYDAINGVVGRVKGDTGERIEGTSNFSVTRTATGKYEVTVPGKTAATGVLLLQNCDFRSDSGLPDNNFLSYQFNSTSGKFEIQARHTTAAGADLEDTDFYVAYVDFTTPPRVSPAFTPQVQFTSITRSLNSLVLNWSGGSGKYLLQKSIDLNTTNWMNLLTTTDTSAIVAVDGAAGFFRIIDNYTGVDVTPLTAYLTVDAEKTGVTGSPTGTGVATLSLEGNKVSWLVTYKGLGSSATLAHIHGFTNTTASANVKQGFANPSGTNGVIMGSATITEDIRTNILNGLTYVNVHTANNGSGEIRGQILRSKYIATLNGANEKPSAITTAGTGAATIWLVGNELKYNVSFANLTSNATASHIHGRADTNNTASVILGFTGVPSATSGTFSGVTLSDTVTRSAIVDGLAYVNIHTANNPTTGEIRGQLVPAP